MIMKVITPGPLSTIQDGGRFGYMSTGFGSGGAMDLRAMRIANLLVGNDPGESALEATVLGPTFHSTEDTVMAITGADMAPTLNGVSIPMYRAISVPAGSEVKLGDEEYIVVNLNDILAIVEEGGIQKCQQNF